LAVAAIVAVAAATFLVLPAGPRAVAPPTWRPLTPEVRGVFHIHTTLSDGTGTIDDVASAAASVGLQVAITTDHGDGTRRPEPPAYRHGVLCIDAVEISTTGGHYAAIGLGQAPYRLGGEPRDVVEDVHRLGGFGIVAHPLSPKAGLAWQDWQAPFDGIEWVNGDSVWRDAPRWRLALSAWTFAFCPIASLTALYQRPTALDRADQLTARRPVVLMAGLDAHARLGAREHEGQSAHGLFLRVPSYQDAFGVMSLTVLLPRPLGGDAAADAEAIVGAIRAGHLHATVDGLARPAAFAFTASSGGVTAVEGGQLPLSGVVTVRARANVPPDGRLVLFRDGTQVAQSDSGSLLYAGNRPGAYRAEAWLPAARGGGFLPWIVGNPVYVGMPEAAPVPEAFDSTGPAFPVAAAAPSWSVERTAGSRGELERAGGGITLRYALAGPEAPAPSVALVSTSAVNPRATGLAFAGRADRPMRISVQVRARAGGDDCRWQRSVYLDPTPREVVIAFHDMRPLDPGGQGSPSAGRLGALLFAVTTTNTRPGRSGQFTLENIRFVSPR
jgi:hypothetical protein